MSLAKKTEQQQTSHRRATAGRLSADGRAATNHTALTRRRPTTLGGHLAQLCAYRELLRSLALKEVRVRYKQSVLGAGWAVLQPFALMVVFTAVFSRFLHVKSEGVPYPVFSYTALVPWTFFAASLSFAVPSIVGNMSLVTKIYFPREVFPLAAIGACFVDFCIAATIVAALIAWYKVHVAWTLLLVPILIILQAMVAIGVCLIASAINVFFRDIRFIIPLATQVWMYVSPVVYPLNEVPERFRPYYMLNPMAGIIDGYRRVVLHGQLPDFGALGVTAAVSLVLLVGGYAFFKRVEMRFADVI
ncbi:MAG: ABC transporter permease [Armatimonadota bacterium]|nr:ABC transporter permease [Armatimonadota bacterium]